MSWIKNVEDNALMINAIEERIKIIKAVSFWKELQEDSFKNPNPEMAEFAQECIEELEQRYYDNEDKIEMLGGDPDDVEVTTD